MLLSSSSLNETSTLQEIRPGRRVHFRKVLLGNKPPTVVLVCLHGTCAASAQYNRLLEALQQQQEPANTTSMVCYLYDAIGCGQSPKKKEWSAYHTDEAVLDLEAVVENHVEETDLPLVLVGHSYAPTILLRYLNRHSSKNDTKHPNKICGLILLSSALKGGPLKMTNHDGGHPIFYLPVCLLNCLEPTMTREFMTMAYHEETDDSLKSEAQQANSANDMGVAKAYHRHHQWASVAEAQAAALHLPTLVIHGKSDGVVPLTGGQHLSDVVKADEFLVVEKASHQVMEEQPKEVAKAMQQYLNRVVGN